MKLIPVGFIPVDTEKLYGAPISSTSASPILVELTAISNPVQNWYRLNSRGDLLPSDTQTVNTFILDAKQPPVVRLVSLYQLYFSLERQGIVISKLWLSGDHAGLITGSGAAVFLDITGDLATSIATLQQILTTATIDFTRAVVDIRFTNPVVLKQL
jgi:hypothetical protein